MDNDRNKMLNETSEQRKNIQMLDFKILDLNTIQKNLQNQNNILEEDLQNHMT